MINLFWTGGPDAYVDGLHAQYEPQLNVLRQLRDNANDIDRPKINAKIERIEIEYKSKLDSIDDCLF